MKNFLKQYKKELLVITVCLVLFTVFSLLDNKKNISLTTPEVGTPMMNVYSSDREAQELNSQDTQLASFTSKVTNDDAMSYSDFVASYGDKRIQFDDSCRGTPNVTSLSVGDTLILDNRSNKIQAVKFIDDLYALPPYHVRVFELKRQGIFYIDCGSSRNVAEVIVH